MDADQEPTKAERLTAQRLGIDPIIVMKFVNIHMESLREAVLNRE